MKKWHLLLAGFVACLFVQTAYAQSKEDIKYKEAAEEMRRDVWAWDMPAFKNRTVPDSLNNESGVVMARHVDISASKRRRKRMYTRIVREMVKINDKAALEEYSEFNYQQFSRTFSSYSDVAETRVLGVRIIKPDGSIKYVDADEAVTISDKRTDKQRKLAISDLQVGDIIDYFVSLEQVLVGAQRILPEVFVLGDDKPILCYSIHTEISDDYTIQYRNSNGAPTFKKKYEDGDVVLDMLVKNIPSLPIGLWMSPFRQTPLIRMAFFNFGDPLIGAPSRGTVLVNPSNFRVGDNAYKILTYQRNATSYATVPFLGDTKQMISNYKKAHRGATDEDIVNFAYYTIRYLALYRVNASDKINVGQARNYGTLRQDRFLLYLNYILVKNDIPTDFVLVTSRYGPRQDDVMLADDFEWMLKTRGTKPIFISAGGVFTNSEYISSEFEDQEALVMEGAKVGRDEVFRDHVNIPRSEAARNIKQEKMKVSLSDDMQLLNIDRTTTVKGHLKNDEQQNLLLFEEYYEEERTTLGVKSSFMEEFADSRRNRTLADEYTNAFARARKDWKDIFKTEINDAFDAEPKEVTKYNISKMGLEHTKPDFVYNTAFTLDGFVKRAGNNYILDIGRLIGGQISIKPAQRVRKVDIYMPFARTFEHEIEIAVPKGYLVEGLDKLKQQVSNGVASFEVTPELGAEKLVLKVRKTYKTAFEPVSHWNDLLKVLDAASDFREQKILFKKA